VAEGFEQNDVHASATPCSGGCARSFTLATVPGGRATQPVPSFALGGVPAITELVLGGRLMNDSPSAS